MKSNKSMTARVGLALSVCGVAGVIGAAVVAMTVPAASAQASPEGRMTGSEASRVATAFDHPQRSVDELPGFLRTGAQALDDVDLSSARFLGDSDGTRAWTILDLKGEVCLVSLLRGDDQWASMTCSSADAFRAHGIGLQSATADDASRLYFVPAGLNTPPGMVRVGDQLIASDPHAATSGRRLLPIAAAGASSGAVELTAFAPVEDVAR